MLDIKFIRENKELIQNNCQKRHVKVDLEALFKLDASRRELTHEVEILRSQRKKKSKGKPTPEEIQNLKELGPKIKKIEDNLNEVMDQYNDILRQIPNLTHPDTPIGGEEDFKVLEKIKEPTTFDFTPKDHETLLTELDLLDFERGAKVSGSKFYYCKNDLVRLNQALINYGINVVSKYGFGLMETPDLARADILEGIGFNPRGEETQVYSVENSDLCLIGTAEITIGGYHSNEILNFDKGPIKYAALSHCFRTEAGSYGRESRGLYRVHQFSKLEMFVFCHPDDSEKMHQEILEVEKEICNGLEIPYRVIEVASGDLGGPAYRKFDLEAWMVRGQEGGDYGEITSCSNCTDYQARRLGIKFRNKEGKLEYAHTLNGTAVVLSRFPIAVVENNQDKDGNISIPKVLRPYMGGQEKIVSPKS